VWAWLVQMGGGRAGWYSRDWLDNNGEPGADRTVAEWQSLEVGQRLASAALAGEDWFTVLVGEPMHFLMQTKQFDNLRDRLGREERTSVHRHPLDAEEVR
jgi:hypothetical protein